MRIDPIIRNLSGDTSKIGMPKDNAADSEFFR